MATEIIDLKNLFEEVTKAFERSETEAILFYSTDKERDFRLLEKRVAQFKERFNILLGGSGVGFKNANQVGVSGREGNLQT